eukprot:9627883-Prorocentrum_lima.AAC.1
MQEQTERQRTDYAGIEETDRRPAPKQMEKRFGKTDAKKHRKHHPNTTQTPVSYTHLRAHETRRHL